MGYTVEGRHLMKC